MTYKKKFKVAADKTYTIAIKNHCIPTTLWYNIICKYKLYNILIQYIYMADSKTRNRKTVVKISLLYTYL